MNRIRSLSGLALALLLAGCATQPLPGLTPANVHPGFDVGRYPGEAALRTWRTASPYRWQGAGR